MNYSKENETWWKRMKEPTTEASPFTCSMEPVDSAPHTIGELPPCLTSPLLYSSALKCMWTVYDVKREQLKGAFHQDSAQIPEMLKIHSFGHAQTDSAYSLCSQMRIFFERNEHIFFLHEAENSDQVLLPWFHQPCPAFVFMKMILQIRNIVFTLEQWNMPVWFGTPLSMATWTQRWPCLKGIFFFLFFLSIA